jgi:ATP-dependent exoDNAse (exonuclease V) beta subunit
LPVKATSSLESTIFRDDYFSELVSRYVDVFNLAYVAFTRAKSILIINCPQPEEPKRESTSAKEMNFLLEKTVRNLTQKELFTSCFNGDETTFEYGEMPILEKTTAPINSTFIERYYSYNYRDRIKLRLSGEDFLITSKDSRSVKNQGKIIHEILSEIGTTDDIGKAFGKAVYEGKITEDECQHMLKNLTKTISDLNVISWFDGSYEVLNERSILKKGNLHRPDRIMISGNSAVVIDYKSGDLELEKYHRQVNGYAHLLKESGFNRVEGYLWYLQLNKIEKVCEF